MLNKWKIKTKQMLGILLNSGNQGYLGKFPTPIMKLKIYPKKFIFFWKNGYLGQFSNLKHKIKRIYQEKNVYFSEKKKKKSFNFGMDADQV